MRLTYRLPHLRLALLDMLLIRRLERPTPKCALGLRQRDLQSLRPIC